MSTVAEPELEDIEISEDFTSAFDSDEIIQDEPEEKEDDAEKGEVDDSTGEESEGNDSDTDESDPSDKGAEDEGKEEEESKEDDDSEKPSEREKALEKQIEELQAKQAKLEEDAKKDEAVEEEEEEEEEAEPEPLKTVDDIVSSLDEGDQAGVKEIFQDFPELKKVLDKIYENSQSKPEVKKAEKKEVKKESKSEEGLSEEDLQEGRFWTSLLTKNPDAREISSTDEFNKWLDSQPKSVQAMAGSLNVDDAIAVLDAYKVAQDNTSKKIEAEKAKKDAKKEIKKTVISGDKKKSESKSGSGDEFADAFYEED